jgi:DNA-binding response OmpR family regulator
MEIQSIENASVLWPAQNSRSMLIVEDETLISMLIEDFATELGWSVAGVAHNERAAFKLLDSITPTIAVLDINLGSTDSFGVAQLCQERGIPVLFTTGYTLVSIPEGCGTCPVLTKPFSPDDFQAAVERCLDGAASSTA